MDKAAEEILIAEGRNEEIEYDIAYVFPRSKLYDALPSSDEKRLHEMTGSKDFLLDQSGANKVKDAISETEDHIKNAMMTREAIYGESSKMKCQCPCMNIGFVNTLKRDRGSKEIGLKQENEPLFLMFNGVNIVFPSQEIVTPALIKHKLIATKPREHGCDYAEPIPLSSSLASIENGSWMKFKAEDSRLPKVLLDDCYEVDTRKSIKKMYTAAKQSDHVYLKEPDEHRRNVGVIAILCETWFEDLDDLDTHVEMMHGGQGLSAYPKAVPVKKREEVKNPPVDAVAALVSGNNSSIIKIRGTTQGPVLEYAAGNSFRKIKDYDTVKDVIEKLLEVIARLKNDYSIFDEADKVIQCYWGDLLEVIRQLFEGNVGWMKQFELAAMAQTDKLDLFSSHCQVSVTVEDLKNWMQNWLARSNQTLRK